MKDGTFSCFTKNYTKLKFITRKLKHISCAGLQLELAVPRNRSYPDVGGWKQSDA